MKFLIGFWPARWRAWFFFENSFTGPSKITIRTTKKLPGNIKKKRGALLTPIPQCVGQGGGVFFNPKILIKASPSMRISQSPCQVFPNLCFCNFMFLWLFLWKGAKIAWGQGGCFFNPKILIKAFASMGTTKYLCQAFPNSCFFSLCSYDYCFWKGG